MHDEIKAILSGEKSVRFENTIRAALNFLGRSKGTSGSSPEGKQNKNEEAKSLVDFAESNSLWPRINFKNYISEGAEQRVFLRDKLYVEKLNDAIYFETWSDYLVNLLLHNYFFPDTAYDLKGFFLEEDILYAVVQQPFVKSDQPTNLNQVKQFLEFNGFENIRNHDYFNPKLSIILEDLHDENVLTQKKNLFFIDTVFYIQE